MPQEAQVMGYSDLAEPMMSAPSTKSSSKVLLMVSLFATGMGCVVLYSQMQTQAAPKSATEMIASMQPLMAQVNRAQLVSMGAAAASLRSQHLSPHAAAAKSFAYASAMGWAARDGARKGCRGDSICTRAVGLFFGTQTGKTEEAATVIAESTGLEAKDIGDISAADLASYDGIIAGVPTWHTGADEMRSGTTWDDYLEEIKALSLSGKPVAVFGLGDQAGYGDNFCDGIEELHNTFESAGAKMVGYTDAGGYEMYTESKSVKDGKFLGLPLDGDNEPDMTEDRVKKWVEQIKSEGMPVL